MRLALLAVLLYTAAFGQIAPPHFRLPADVRPERYRVELELVPAVETFRGVIAIELKVDRETPAIWLNASDIAVKSSKLTVNGKPVEHKVIPGGKEFVGFETARPLAVGKAHLEIHYEGQQNTKGSDGIFRNKVGEEWYSFTQFEAVAARRAFPCFDEPGYKVPWQLSLKVKKDHVAVANTPASGEKTGSDGMKTVQFAETKPLPSYLVAFAAGPFDVVPAGTAGKKKTPIRIIVTKGRAGEAKYAVESTGKILTLLEEYFGIPYPYEKLDEVALPYVGFAMENPGLITYGEGMILAKPEQDTPNRQRSFAGVAAHEMAHQWFGDLVTMQWWNDLWLNEAFASWMGEKIEYRFQPEWKADVWSLNGKFHAMEQDSLLSARRIRQPVESKDDIANAFDGITYQKGAAVIKMFEKWVGEEKFRTGVASYLKEHAHANATAEDFLGSITAASGVNVNAPFSTFLDQSGFPLLTMALSCGNGAPSIRVTQKRSLPLGSEGGAKQSWQVPVCVAYADGNGRARECRLVSEESVEWKLEKARSCPAWVLGNEGSNGYYRTKYEGGLLKALLADHAGKLTEAERVGVIREVSDLTLSGELPVGDALALVPEFAGDSSRTVVESLIEMTTATNRMVPAELTENFARFIRKSFGERARQLGWLPKAGEDDEQLLLRQKLLPLVAIYGREEGLSKEARSLAERWLTDPKAVPPPMVNPVLTAAAAGGDRALFDRYVTALRNTKDPQVRHRLYGAVGSFRDREIAKAGLRLFLDKEFDPRESFGLLSGPVGDPRTSDLPFEFVKDNWAALREKLPRSVDTDMAAFLPFTARGMCSEEGRAEAERFFTDKMKNATGGPRNLAQTLESMRICAAARKANGPGIAEFLRQY